MSQNRGYQVQSLDSKLNPNQAAKREVRIEARRTVAQELGRAHAQTRGMAVLSYNLGIYNRKVTLALLAFAVVKLVAEVGALYYYFWR